MSALAYRFVRDNTGALFGAVSSDGTQIGVGAGPEWQDAITWNAQQATPDDLQTHPPATSNPTPAFTAAVTGLKQYMALQQQGTPAQMDRAIQAICVVLKSLRGDLNQ